MTATRRRAARVILALLPVALTLAGALTLYAALRVAARLPVPDPVWPLIPAGLLVLTPGLTDRASARLARRRARRQASGPRAGTSRR